MPIVTFLAQSTEDPVVDPATQATFRGRLSMYSNKLLSKASQFWIDMGKPGVKSPLDWKRRTYVTGERLMDRIEYHEWSLKSINHVLGPHFADLLDRISSKTKPRHASVDAGHIPLLYPSKGEAYAHVSAFKIEPSVLLSSLRNLAQTRVPHHRRLLFWSIVAMPLTIPVAILPVIPNLPFFYLCWRAFSHWQAMRASSRILVLLEKGRVVPTPSLRMESAFNVDPNTLAAEQRLSAAEEAEPHPDSSSEKDATLSIREQDPRLTLQPIQIAHLKHSFGLDQQAVIDLTRARTQLIGQLEEDQAKASQRGNKSHKILHHLHDMAAQGDKVPSAKKE